MKLPFEPYDPEWNSSFEQIKKQLSALLHHFNLSIDHIGSTSVEGLSAKPIIDIQLGVANQSELDMVALVLQLPNVVYYEQYNEAMPGRRFFVMFRQSTQEMGVAPIIKINETVPEILQQHHLRIAHIHAFVKDSEDWIRHIAFRDYLRAYPEVKLEYQNLKQRLIQQEWKDGNEYNKAKDSFLKKHEAIALDWYKKTIGK